MRNLCFLLRINGWCAIDISFDWKLCKNQLKEDCVLWNIDDLYVFFLGGTEEGEWRMSKVKKLTSFKWDL